MKKLFNEEQIEKRIHDFEEVVDFEFIPVIANKSVSTNSIPIIIFLILALLCIFLHDWVVRRYFAESWLPAHYFLMIGLMACSLLTWILFSLKFVSKWIIGRTELLRQVHRSAYEVFFLKRLHELKSHNALLIYVSMYEKKIVILPDSRTKIDNIQKLSDESLQVLRKNFKKKKYQEGFLEVIDFLEKELKDSHPRKTPDAAQSTNGVANQYDNKVIWWED